MNSGSPCTSALLIEVHMNVRMDVKYDRLKVASYTVRVMLANCSGLAQKVKAGMEVGTAAPAEVVEPFENRGGGRKYSFFLGGGGGGGGKVVIICTREFLCPRPLYNIRSLLMHLYVYSSSK